MLYEQKNNNSHQYICNWPHSIRPGKESAFVNTNINIPHNLCGAVSMNGGLADWFSFLTRALERQFNLFSSLLPGRLFFFLFYICAFLSKNVNMTLSALSTFSAVTDITWPQFTEGTEETHPCSTIWIYYHPEMSCIQHLRSILNDVENPSSLHLNKTKLYLDVKKRGLMNTLNMHLPLNLVTETVMWLSSIDQMKISITKMHSK